MDSLEIMVTAGGVGLIGLVLWYFFFSTRPVVSAVASSAGVQEIHVLVKGGYTPDVLEVEKGKPVQLHFYRDEEASCSEEILFPDFHIRRELPAFQTTLIELVPQQSGRYEFTCGMGMLRGSLIVK